MIPILDTHLHLLYPENFSYDWCAGLPALNRAFHLDEYLKLIEGHGVQASIFMEVDVSEDEIAAETKFFSELAAAPENSLQGVIASCRPERTDFPTQLEKILSTRVCALRRVLHTMPDDLSQQSQFRENIRSLASHNLPFDLCVTQAQLGIAHELAADCPDVSFILNHCGVPSIQAEQFSAWKQGLTRLAELPNVNCKISGILAYCSDADSATLETIQPWLETSVETFGFERLVFGSDWPVCNLTRGLPVWLEIARRFFSSYSNDEQHAVFHRNAERIYSQPVL